MAPISSGNYGAAVSYGASRIGIEKAVVIVPETTPRAKVEKIRYYGGEARLMGRNYDEAHALGMDFINGCGMVYIDSCYDDPKIYGGQGTVGPEILRQNPGIDTILVPIGGGGLITGIAVAAKVVKPDVRLIGVQSEVCPAMQRALEGKFLVEGARAAALAAVMDEPEWVGGSRIAMVMSGGNIDDALLKRILRE